MLYPTFYFDYYDYLGGWRLTPNIASKSLAEMQDKIFGGKLSGFEKFDKAYEDGTISKIFTTNLVYSRPGLKEKPWHVEVNMCKYVSYIIDTLNHDATISGLLDPAKRINTIVAKHRNEMESHK